MAECLEEHKKNLPHQREYTQQNNEMYVMHVTR